MESDIVQRLNFLSIYFYGHLCICNLKHRHIIIMHMRLFTNCELYYHGIYSYLFLLSNSVEGKGIQDLYMKAELRRWGNTEAEPKQEEDASPNLEDRISKSKPPPLCCKITMALITWTQGQTLSEGWC